MINLRDIFVMYELIHLILLVFQEKYGYQQLNKILKYLYQKMHIMFHYLYISIHFLLFKIFNFY